MAASSDAFVALTRFGLGPRSGDMAIIAGDPRGFVLEQCGRPETAVIEGPSLESSGTLIAAYFDARRAKKAFLTASEVASKATSFVAGLAPAGAGNMDAGGKDAGGMEANGMDAGGMEAADAPGDGMEPAGTRAPADKRADKKRLAKEAKARGEAGPPNAGVVARETMRRELAVRFDHAYRTVDPFTERLVMFWSNHFCVSASKNGVTRILAGAYEREAIRPNVLGRFRDMLGACVKHPAMLAYLDNTNSTGPNSRQGKVRKVGLNENLAREALELHTLGVDGGYTQTDVTNFARILTGWTFEKAARDGGDATIFEAVRHEPGAWTVVGRSYPDTGEAQLDAVLDDLARNPATARHVARKLVRHFVADDAPPGLADTVAAAFRDSDGDLAVTVRALASADAAWTPPLSKSRSPYELFLATTRATNVPVGNVFQASRMLGQEMWSPPSPAGFSDDDTAWIAGDALLERLDWATTFSRRSGGDTDARTLGVALFGQAYDPQTRTVVERAETGEQALALLLMSPAFQRR